MIQFRMYLGCDVKTRNWGWVGPDREEKRMDTGDSKASGLGPEIRVWTFLR